jgi:hypothetical protein
MYVCMHVHLQLKKELTNLHQTWHAYSLRPGREHRKVKTLEKNVLSSISGEGSSCSLETVHNRRTAPWSKLFASKRRLQKQKSQPQRTVLSLSPDVDGFSSSETKHNRTVERTKLFVSARRLQELRPQTWKLSWVQISVKMLGLGIIIFSMIFNNMCWMIRPMISFWAIKTDKKCKHFSNFPSVTPQALC